MSPSPIIPHNIVPLGYFLHILVPCSFPLQEHLCSSLPIQLKNFNWRMIALHCCVGFCHTTLISCKSTYIPSLTSPNPTPLDQHRALELSPLGYTAAPH